MSELRLILNSALNTLERSIRRKSKKAESELGAWGSWSILQATRAGGSTGRRYDSRNGFLPEPEKRNMERRLAAIVAADVSGYSRLMERDEAGTLAALQSRFSAFINPKISQHHGRMVKTTGDGFLVEFSSAVNAVQFAVELQRDMASANAPLPKDQRMEFRIGINLGDVMCEDGDLFGEGVNVAARLEGLADPGGICIAANIRDQVRGKVSLDYDELGPQSLKNITEPVNVYRVRIAGGRNGSAKSPSGRPGAQKPSIAVLPFVNIGSGQEQAYFSDGISEDIITELARFPSLYVIARSTSFRYRGDAIDVQQVGRDLNVQYVLEGSVRKAGDRVRITAQLIDARNANHLWAERYDRNMSDLFAIQDEVVRTIVGTLVGRVQGDLVERARQKPTSSLAAYDYVLRAVDALRGAYFNSGTFFQLGTDSAREMLHKALELDPEYGLAFAYLGFSYHVDFCYLGNRSDAEEAYRYAKRGVVLNPNDYRTHLWYGQICLVAKQYDEAGSHIRRAAAINPNDPEVMAALGLYLDLIGDHEGAIATVTQALELSPFDRDWLFEQLGFAHYGKRDYAQSIDAFKRINSAPHWTHAHLAAAYAHIGRAEEARREAQMFMDLHPWEHEQRTTPDTEYPNVPRALIGFVRQYKNPGDFQHWIDGWRKAGLPV